MNILKKERKINQMRNYIREDKTGLAEYIAEELNIDKKYIIKLLVNKLTHKDLSNISMEIIINNEYHKLDVNLTTIRKED